MSSPKQPTHILVVNGVKVRKPVFVIGAPHSGADLVGRAIMRASGFHLTDGAPSVNHVIYAFARKPSLADGTGPGPSRVIRDAFAEAWLLPPDASGVTRFGDATAELLYCAPLLLRAFPDARLIQVIRDGMSVAADMLADPACLAWFKPALLAEGTEYPNPFFGLTRAGHRDRWADLPPAGKCALRWRGAVRLSAQYRSDFAPDQLLTLRFEELTARPAASMRRVSEFLEAEVGPFKPAHRAKRRLQDEDARLVAKIARDELRRLGYLKEQ